MKEAVDKIPEMISEVKQTTTTLLGFVTLIITFLILGIVGISHYSKLPLWCNVAIISGFLLLLFYILIRTFNTAIKDPKLFIYNQNAFLLQEQLSDSDSQKVYYSGQLPEQNTEAPKQLGEQS